MPDSYTNYLAQTLAPKVERKSAMGLVKFPCGCVGWPTINEDERVLVIEHCDYDARDGGGALSPGYRDVKEPAKAVPVSLADEYRLLDEIGRLLVNGYKLDALRSILD